MNKNIIIRVSIIVAVIGVIHTVFWFFKTGQLEKQVTSLIAANNGQISADEVKVAGYPLSQKLLVKNLKFTIPNPAFSKYQTTIQSLEAKAGIFDNNFQVKLLDKVLVQDNAGTSGSVEFNQEPQISLIIDSGMLVKFTYQDNGYKVTDSGQNTIYGVGSSNIAFESSIEDGDKIKSRVKADFKEVENFDILNVYKNSSEKNVIDNIKNGQIAVSGGVNVVVTDQQNLNAGQNPAMAAGLNPATNIAVNPTVNPAANPTANNVAVAANPAVAPANPVNNVANPAAANAALPTPVVAPAAPVMPSAVATPATAPNPVAVNTNVAPTQIAGQIAAVNNGQLPTANPALAVPPVNPTDAQSDVVAMDPNLLANNTLINNGLIKSDFSMEVEFLLTPNNNSAAPTDPTQIQQTPVQYSKTIKIVSAELSNALYKITVNGTLNSFADDNMPSGALTIEIQRSSALIDYLSAGLLKMSDQKLALVAPEAQAIDLANNNNNAQEAYNNLIRKISLNLKPVAIELAAKNKLTKEDDFVFEVRREKNLEFLVNETPVREILGKFN